MIYHHLSRGKKPARAATAIVFPKSDGDPGELMDAPRWFHKRPVAGSNPRLMGRLLATVLRSLRAMSAVVRAPRQNGDVPRGKGS